MKKLLFPLLLLAVVATSCKNQKFNSKTALEITQDNKVQQDYFEFFNNAIEAEADTADGTWKMGFHKTDTIIGVTKCVTITWDTVSQEKVLHYGLDSLGNYANCECSDGLNRRGHVVLTFAGKFFEDGVTTTATLEDFYVDDHKVTGTVTVVHMAQNQNGNPERTIDVVNASVTAPDNSWTTSWQRSQVLEMIKGANTLWWPFDNIFKVTETGSGIGRRGDDYTYTTVTPIMIRWDCINLLVDGEVELTSGDQFVASMDLDPIGTYDPNGETQPCDLAFSITTPNGKVHQFFY
ncbi:MAG: hypothetical protein H6581_01155 [Bacteroidia bacterium]|nr:hypothetical protein [Bacteroidia bacterium]